MKQSKPIYFLLLCISFSVFANLPQDQRVPGGMAVIKLPEQYSKQERPPKILFKNEQVALARLLDKGRLSWYAIVGLPLTIELGEHDIEILENKQLKKISFQIKDKIYPEEKLFFKRSEHVKPNPELSARIEREAAHLNNVFSQWTDARLDDFTLTRPVKGRISSEYGKKRLINNELKSRHRGIDIAAPTGTPITVAKKGKVVDVGDYFYTGNTVIVDHGQGFKTIYCHLDSVSVNQGDFLEEQKIIGTVGQTGRATGAHLHFGVSLNNTRVSPDLFFKEQ